MKQKSYKTRMRDGIKEVSGYLYTHKDIKYFIYKTESGRYFSVEYTTGLGICECKLLKECVKETNDKIETAYDYIVKIRNEHVLLKKEVNV